MELILKRETRTDCTTIGNLTIDGVFQCYILEDYDRGLCEHKTLAQIQAVKVKGKTCIPAGRYKLAWRYSPGRKAYTPYLVGVIGFDYILIHPGNDQFDTDGCLIPGRTKSKDFVGESKLAYAALIFKIQAACEAGTAYITIS